MASLIKVTMKRSLSKCTERQLATLLGLGLSRRHQTRVLKDTKEIRGMVLAIQHLLDVERLDGDESQLDSARIRRRREAQASA